MDRIGTEEFPVDNDDKDNEDARDDVLDENRDVARGGAAVLASEDVAGGGGPKRWAGGVVTVGGVGEEGTAG